MVIDVNQLSSGWHTNATLLTADVAEDWDISNGAIWGPDYQDPSTLFFRHLQNNDRKYQDFHGYDDPNNAAAAQVGLKDYDALSLQQFPETIDLNARYDLVAFPSPSLLKDTLVIPLTVGNGAAPVIFTLDTHSQVHMQVGGR